MRYPFNARQEAGMWLRRADHLHNEAVIALTEFEDQEIFKIYDDGASKAQMMADHWLDKFLAEE